MAAVDALTNPVLGQNAHGIDIRGLTIGEMEHLAAQAGERRFRASQLAGWLYGRGAESFDQMLELPREFRETLKQRFTIGGGRTAMVARAADGTRKLLISMVDGAAIETVIIPGRGRTTLCVSSQAGCAMRCSFCATARMGLGRNLDTGEILNQIFLARLHLEPDEAITNFVFMGMGEPLANYVRLLKALRIMTSPWGMGVSPRRITVSTVGIVPAMERLLSEMPVRLAVSLHATTNEVRDRLAPINRRYPLEALIEGCRRLPMKHRDRITFEYVMLRGVNDSADDARRLIKLIGPLRAKVNLIFFNTFRDSGFESSPRAVVEDFQAQLLRGNLTATIRESRGDDIAAACGQLRAEQGGQVSE